MWTTPEITSNNISAFWDMMPTFAEIAEIKSEKSDGISFLPTLLSKKQKKHTYLYQEFPKKETSKAIRMGKWKGYISNYKKGDSKMELFNLRKDPREQNNIADKNPQVVCNLRERWTKHTLRRLLKDSICNSAF